jgi:hypothetical protein
MDIVGATHLHVLLNALFALIPQTAFSVRLLMCFTTPHALKIVRLAFSNQVDFADTATLNALNVLKNLSIARDAKLDTTCFKTLVGSSAHQATLLMSSVYASLVVGKTA